MLNTREDFDRAYGALADLDYVHPTVGKTALEMFAGEPVMRFLHA